MRFVTGKRKYLMAMLIAVAAMAAISTAQNPSDSAFEDIVVTGVKSGIKRSNATEYMTIIDSLDLKVLNASRIEDVLKTVPGLSITQKAGIQLSINGFAGSYSKILINGVPVVDGDAAFGLNLRNIPLGDVERIEIMKGSGSALYGSDAVAGVVNIITKRNTGTRIASVELRQRYASNIGSSQWEQPGFIDIQPRDGERSHWGGALNGSALVSHNNDFLGVQADAGYYRDAGAVDTLQSRIYGDRPYYSIPRELRRNLGVKIGSDRTPLSSVTGSFKYADNLRVSSVSSSQKLTLSARRIDGSVVVEHELRPSLTLGGYVTAQHYRKTRERYSFDHAVLQEQETTEFPTVDAEAKTTIEAGNSHAITVGLAGGYEAVEAVYIAGGGKSATHAAPFIQDIINIGGKDMLIFTPGLRYSWNSRFAGALTPDLGLRINIIPQLHIRAKAGGAYKAPTFKDNYRDDWVHTGGIFVLSGNPDLIPERSWGVNGGIGGMFLENVSVEMGVHATKLFDQISTQEISKDTGTTARGEHYDAVRAYVNRDSAYTRGLDISLQYSVSSKLRVKAAYSLLESKYWNDDGILTESESYSPHTVKASVYYQSALLKNFRPSIMADLVWQSAQNYLSSATGELRAVTDINAAIEVPIMKIGAVTLGARNLLDNAYEEWNQATGRTLFTELRISIADITNPFNKQ